MKSIILSIFAFLLNNMVTIHKGTLFAKLKSSVILGAVASPVVSLTFFKNWFIDNYLFFILLFSALMLDLLIGVFVHLFKFKDFTLKKMVQGFLSKCYLTSLGFGCFEIFKILFKLYNVDVGDYVKLTIALIVMSYPLFSAIGNLSVATDGKFPPIGWINRMNKYKESLNPFDLINKKEEK